MNAQFQMTQFALSDLVNLAKNSTAEQMALGKTQVEELTAVLRQMMVQLNESRGALNESTEESMNRVSQVLTVVVNDLASKVGDLSEKMGKTLEENANRATTAASEVVQQASAWSAKSSDQLEQVLQQQQSHLRNVREVEASLMSALELFNDSVNRYATSNAGLEQIAHEVSAMATAAAGAAHSTQESQKAIQQVATQAAGQVAKLADANQEQQKVWDKIRDRMVQYEEVFTKADRSAASVLKQLTQAANSFHGITREKYDDLVNLFDEHVSAAVHKLGGSVAELSDSLDDLNDNLDKRKNDGRRT